MKTESAPSPTQTALSPHRAAEIMASFASQGMLQHLGARLDKLDFGRCEITLPLSAKVQQQHGFFHGGAIGTVCDVAAAYAGFLTQEQGASGVSVEYKINFLAPADGEVLKAVGQILKAGRTLCVSEARAYSLKKGVETLCAVAQLTLYVKRGSTAQI